MADRLINDKLEEWTVSKNPLAARIAVFENIRNIPYAIVSELRDPITGPAGLLKLHKGSCIPKHFLLALMFGRLGIEVKYTTHTFNWDDPVIKYPPDIRALARKIPLGAHLVCKAKIYGKWVLVDATWDLPLKKAGYPVNEKWDGIRDLKSAVSVIEETVHENLKDRLAYYAAIKNTYAASDKTAYDEFIQKLNPWLAKLRYLRSTAFRNGS